MNCNDPIRIDEFRAGRAVDAFSPQQVSRAEAARQFRFSLALVVTLVAGTLAVASTLPAMGPAQQGPQLAQTDAAGGLVATVVR